jgi:hypothetical protein
LFCKTSEPAVAIRCAVAVEAIQIERTTTSGFPAFLQAVCLFSLRRYCRLFQGNQ